VTVRTAGGERAEGMGMGMGMVVGMKMGMKMGMGMAMDIGTRGRGRRCWRGEQCM